MQMSRAIDIPDLMPIALREALAHQPNHRFACEWGWDDWRKFDAIMQNIRSGRSIWTRILHDVAKIFCQMLRPYGFWGCLMGQYLGLFDAWVVCKGGLRSAPTDR